MLVRTKGILASKTAWFAVAVAVLALLEAVMGFLAEAGITTPWVLSVLAVLVAVLRLLTNQPISMRGGDLKEVEQ